MNDDERIRLIVPTELINHLEDAVERTGRMPRNADWDSFACYYLYDIAVSLRLLCESLKSEVKDK